MSNFWANKLGQQAAPTAPAAAPAPAQAPANTGAWWMPQATVQQPVQQPMQQVVQQGNPAQMSSQEVIDANQALLHQEEYTTDKAKSAKVESTCPDCGSPNFMRPSTSPNAMKQCFNCGYNERFQHSTHGATGIGQSDLPTKAARVQMLNTNNFNPRTVIGKVTAI